MNRKQVVLIVVLSLVVVFGIGVGVLSRTGKLTDLPGISEPTPAKQESIKSGFTSEVSKNLTPTTPAIEAPAAPNSKEKLGIFNMSVSSSGFDPAVLTVKKGNLVKINLTSVGGDYDFYMPYAGLYVSVRKGETKEISWGANTVGAFTFECRDYCPPFKKIAGSLNVIPQ